MEGIRKIRLQKRRTDDDEENLKITGIRKLHIAARPEGMQKSIGNHRPQEVGGGLRRRRQGRRKRKKRRRRRRKKRRGRE